MRGNRPGKFRPWEADGAGDIERAIRHVLWGAAAPFVSTLLGYMPLAHADDREASPGLAEVVVTAQKRAENLQDVPISIQALGTEKLEQMNVASFNDYAKLVPSLSFEDSGPSFEHSYMRGVVSGGAGQNSGSQPSVGLYLDEQPVTTIDGDLNVHIYDIERIEALAGPQGTLYGASSESGTIRIITNKPDPGAFKAAYNLEGNTVAHGGNGYKLEGFVNLPLTANAAVRLVGWDEKDAGFIDNVPGSVTFPSSGIVFNNAGLVRKDYNDVETKGGRAAVKVILGDNWTVLPQVMGQVTDANGNFSYNPAVGDLETVRFLPETAHDSWVQAALTVQGKIADFDLVYAGAWLNRNLHSTEDYTDYSLFYDEAYGLGMYDRDNAGHLINPAQWIVTHFRYTKLSNELRVTSPQSWPVRFTLGLFQERQVNYILDPYIVGDGSDQLGSVPPYDYSVPGWPGRLWLTDQVRVDRDHAAFTEISWDIVRNLTLNTGIRYYTYDNTLDGFYGFNSTYSTSEGVATCFNDVPFRGAPCSDLAGRSTGSGNTPKVNLTYKLDANKLIYATWSKGYRPGGVNRNGGGKLPPYKPDYLTNYEIGWKTSWLDHTLRWNGAVFDEKWKDFQFSYLGPNSLSIIANAGQAEVRGVESDLEWAITRGFTLSGGISLLDPKLTQEYCEDPTLCGTPGYEQYAPNGTQLPITPKVKGNLTGRYNFPILKYTGYVQGSMEYVGSRWADLRLVAREALGQEPAYAVADFAAGFQADGWTAELYVSNAFDRRAALDRYAECDPATCGTVAIYTVPNQPRTLGLRFGQKF
ncbi:MAG TPA: TonB-dependent receptor [Steroidobacteraceae bacterium]|nr:TonB-dependent receptor [Steroidobacteraceae bacterium]